MTHCPACFTDRTEKEMIQGICFHCGYVPYPSRLAARLDGIDRKVRQRISARRRYLKHREERLAYQRKRRIESKLNRK